MVHGGTKPDHKFVRRRPRLSRGAGIYVSRPIRIWLLPACAVRSCPRSRKDAFAAFRASRPEKVNRRVPQRYPRLPAWFCNDTPRIPQGFATDYRISIFRQMLQKNGFPPSFQSDTSAIQPKISTLPTDAPPPRRIGSRQRPIRVNPCPIFRQPLMNQPLAGRSSRQNTRNTACRAAHHHPRTNQDPTFGTPKSPPPGKPEKPRFINAKQTRRRSETSHRTAPPGPDSPSAPNFETETSHAQCRKCPFSHP